MMKTMFINTLRKKILTEDKCSHCKDAILEILEKFKNDKAFRVRFNPDMNVNGIITHWHIDCK